MEMTVKTRQAEADSDDQLYDNLQQDGAYTDVHAPLLSAESCHHDNSSHDNRATFRLEEAVEFMGFGRFQIMMIFFMGMFSSSDAMEMMLIAILSPILRCEWWLENWQVALFTTMVFVGMLIFSLPFGSLADRRGRWPVLWMSAFGVSYFGFLTTFSPTYMWVLVLRTLVGVSFAASPQGNTLLMEFLPSKFRAKVAVTFQLFWAAGSTLEIMLAYLVVPTLGWRYLVAFSCVPMTVVLLLYRFIPESARYCLAAGQRGKAMDILNRIARMNRTTLPPGTLVKSAEVWGWLSVLWYHPGQLRDHEEQTVLLGWGPPPPGKRHVCLQAPHKEGLHHYDCGHLRGISATAHKPRPGGLDREKVHPGGEPGPGGGVLFPAEPLYDARVGHFLRVWHPRILRREHEPGVSLHNRVFPNNCPGSCHRYLQCSSKAGGHANSFCCSGPAEPVSVSRVVCVRWDRSGLQSHSVSTSLRHQGESTGGHIIGGK